MSGGQRFEHFPSEARLARPGLCHGEMLGCMVEVFGQRDSVWVSDWLDEASRPLFGAGRLGLGEQASMLTELLADELGLLPDVDDHRGLLLDHAVRVGTAHPLLLATLGHELGRRAGLHVHVCTAQRAWWTALVDDQAYVLVGCGAEPAAGDPKLRLRCPHQVAFAALMQLMRLGPPELAAPAKRLMCALPVCHGKNDA